ncbi:radical SAM domain-containing protein [Candidatus Magnetobacterium bavaricum]|uniref:Radical SAM domain-containing protein n=1 Tax=Candidatus Magnetobacterium bavaricum TaxID=29290 RepID=A0A0F3GKY3_9BACT|nr:radical SAM domain-containing protein [Candidatus Magnetobacterium bavaricum]
MKILLLYPNLYGINTLPPAIGLFTAILKNDGHQVRLFDTTVYEGLYNSSDADKQKSENLNARPYDDSLIRQYTKNSDAENDFLSLVRNYKPDLIAMSATEDMYSIGVNILSHLDNHRPPVVAGGVFPTFAPELALKMSNNKIDMLLIGEGENTLPELCRKLERGDDISTIDGLCTIKEGKLTQNCLPKPVDLNIYPLPDYSLFEESRFYRPMQGKLRRMLPITTIRGCPFTCGYCNSPSQRDIYKNSDFDFFRKKDIEHVYKELKHCLQNYRADSFYFWADTFLAWNEYEFESFCDMYSEFKLPFWIQTRPETVTEHRFKRLKEVGLLRVAFGVEHGNEEFRRKVLLRKVSNNTIIDNLNIVTSLKIPISVNNILGFPTETRELAFDTIELNRHIRSDGINAYSYTPFHGTPLRILSEQLGYVNKNSLATSITNPTMISMPHFTKKDIEGLRRCFVLYVKMPRHRWKEIEKAESLTPEGDAIWKELKDECLSKYMHYDDNEKHDDD